jgi:DNA polymerase-4
VDHPRAILHVDMDAFYASVEQRDDPRLKGKPVAVGGASRRGVVCAASYEARPFGVRSAMPMARALRLCPGLIVVPPDFSKYTHVSDQVFDVFHSFTPEVEGLSLDEAFLDVTRSQSLLGTPVEQARNIKARIRAETKLTASVGISEVKFAAKIASDLCKPDGLLEVPRGQVREFLAPLPASRLWGVGPRTDELLKSCGLRKIGEVAVADPGFLEARLGSIGPWLHDLANGIDPRSVEADAAAKSIGAEETFEDDLEGEDLLPFIHEQSLRVASRLRRNQLKARTVHLKVKYADFKIATRQETLPVPTDDGTEIYRIAARLLTRTEARPIRLTGVHAGDFAGDAKPQLGLFDHSQHSQENKKREEAERRKRDQLNKSLDKIAAKFGEAAVVPADLLEARKK